MATRILPGAYVSLNDLSQLPEGQTSLNVGYVVKANRGPVNKAELVTSPTDFLTKYTLSGKPALNEDPTFYSVLKVLGQTNSVYISRAANNPLYGGIVFKKEVSLGDLNATSKSSKTITFEGTTTLVAGDKIMVKGTGIIDGYYTVVSSATSGSTIVVTVSEEVGANLLYKFPVTSASSEASVNKFVVTGDVSSLKAGDKVTVKGATVTANNKVYTVVSATYTSENESTEIVVSETVTTGTDGNLYIRIAPVKVAPGKALTTSIADPANYQFDNTEDLFLITGIDPGAYNGDLSFEILSATDNPTELVYYVGADLGTETPCTFNTMQLTVKNANTNEVLETFLFSRDENAKTIDGISLYIGDVLASSAYIQVRNNSEATTLTDLPSSTVGAIKAGAGSNGNTVDAYTLGAALIPFSDKTVPVSILGNGCSAEAETSTFQQALLGVVTTRKDCITFLNTRKSDESATLSSTKAQNIVDYKKGDLGSVSFYGTMYGPHVNSTDIYNNRQINIGCDAVAINGWLSIINTLNYPYAYAGPQNGLVSGVTCDWKIGDESVEAQLLNDASVNYIAYDGKVGRYYMQCQNTLQIANSTMRNIGAVLNVLDIKEHFSTYLKEYLQLPITDTLRQSMMTTMQNYLEPMVGNRFYQYSLVDVSSENDIADNTLRFTLALSITKYLQKVYLTINVVNNSYFTYNITQSL